MKHFILLITIITSFFSCTKDTKEYVLQGKAIGFPDGARIYVNQLNDNGQPEVIDTLIVQGGFFEAVYPNTDKLSMNFLKADYTNQNVFYFPENSDLKVTLYKDSIQASTVLGAPQNEAFNAFKNTLQRLENERLERNKAFSIARRDKDAEKVRALTLENNLQKNAITNHKIDFIQNNPNSLYAPMLLDEMVSKKAITASVAIKELNNLSPKVAASAIGKSVITKIQALKQTDIGGEAPMFSAATPVGDILALEDALGKYTIIDFWASWCRPCRMENPNVVRVYEQYHDKGLNIISVSLDRPGQKDRWIQAIKDDNMDWYHVSNLQFWNDPIAKQYGVRSIPATFLLDENGIIIDKNLRGAALGNRIASLLK